MTQPALQQAAIRRVSLFAQDGKFFEYVSVRGAPRAVTYKGRVYVCFDSTGPRFENYNFREVPHEDVK